MTLNPASDETCDVLVIGSGAGGLAAAVTAAKLGLKVIVAEKAPVFGGTTARSGGYLWIPCNPVSARAGAADSREEARAYLRSEAGTHYDAPRVDAFLGEGPCMVDFFEHETEVRFLAANAFPDYYPSTPGAVDGGRSILAAPYDGRLLGPEIKRLRPPLREITFVGMALSASQEVKHFFNATRSLRSALYVARRLMQHGWEMARYARPMRLTNGNALVGRLMKTALALGVDMRENAPARELLRDGEAATGAVLETSKGRVCITVRRGVVLACGGFPHDPMRQKQLYPHVARGGTHLSPAPDTNTGDGLRLAESAGGRVEEGLPNAAAWIPASIVTYANGKTGVFPHLIDRYKPGVIAVTKDGKRFVNESDSYHDFGQALLKTCGNAVEISAWLICDHRALRRYGLGFAKPFPLPLFMYLRSGYLQRGKTPEGLAARIGVDPTELAQTIADFNVGAAKGEDSAFGRGKSSYNRFLGDPEHRPNACVAPLNAAPFYAIKVMLGDLGTFAGIKTDAFARVLNREGRPIAGLHAVGNDMASVMGGAYPGGGITLGPAMTFGYIAGKFLAAQTKDSA